MNDSPVYFYEVEDEYGLFSNFAPRPIELEGKVWPMSEHYYQAHRFEGTYLMETVRNIKEPMDAALFGRNPENPTRPDWFDHRVAAMLRAVRAKVAQHSDVRDLLRSTGNRPIAEHTANDSFWGDGGDGSGANTLGRILMQVRHELQAEESGRNVIFFYGDSEAYGFFGNFSNHPVILRGKYWPTSEHFYQGIRFEGTEKEDIVRALPTPLQTFKFVRDPLNPSRPDWMAIRDDRMLEVIRAKADQHPAIRAALLATGDAEIVEHSTNDSYWADGGDGSGVNRLGKIWMQVRDELRAGG